VDTKNKMQVLYQGQRNEAMENAIVEAARLQGFQLISNEMNYTKGMRVLSFVQEDPK